MNLRIWAALAACPMNADVVFAVDTATSVNQEQFEMEQNFVRRAALGLNLDTDSYMGLVSFSDKSWIRFNLKDFKNSTSVSMISAISLAHR